MDDQPNPYESPRTAARSEGQRDGEKQNRLYGWKIALLGAVILCGLASFVPWLAIIFAVGSSPVFIRYYMLRQRIAGGTSPDLASKFAGVIGGGGLAFGTLAAAAGACMGTCTTTMWGAVLYSEATKGYSGHEEYFGGFFPGVAIGAIAFCVVIVWLVHQVWPD